MPTHFYAAYGGKTAVRVCDQADAEEARQVIERHLKTPIKRTDRRRHEARNALIAAFEADTPDVGMITALTIWLAHGQLGRATYNTDWCGYEIIPDHRPDRSHTFRLMAGLENRTIQDALSTLPELPPGSVVLIG